MSAPTVIDEGSVPRLPRGVRIKFDRPRDQWVILAPERMFVLDAVGLDIARACDGAASVSNIVAGLAETYKAPYEVILGDVVRFLQDFADKGVIVA